MNILPRLLQYARMMPKMKRMIHQVKYCVRARIVPRIPVKSETTRWDRMATLQIAPDEDSWVDIEVGKMLINASLDTS